MSSTAAPASKPKKVKTAKSPSTHPTYADMIKAAMTKLTTRKGVSKIAISKYIQENYTVNPSKNDAQLKQSLKRMLDQGILDKHKGVGAAGSFKFAKSFLEKAGKKKKPAAKPASKPAAKKPSTPKKKPAAKKPASAPKKPSPKKTKPKPKAKAPAKPAKARDTKKPAKKPAAKKPPAKKPKTPTKKGAKK